MTPNHKNKNIPNSLKTYIFDINSKSKISSILINTNLILITFYLIFESKIKEKYEYFSKLPHGRDPMREKIEILHPETVFTANGIYEFLFFILIIVSLANFLIQKNKKIQYFIPVVLSTSLLIFVYFLPKAIYYYSSLQYI